jgi:hypothetical protein
MQRLSQKTPVTHHHLAPPVTTSSQCPPPSITAIPSSAQVVATPEANGASRLSNARQPTPAQLNPPTRATKLASSLSLSKEQLQRITPHTLRARLRSILVQLVLLSPEPLRPSALLALFSNVADAETADFFACASHAVLHLYDCAATGMRADGQRRSRLHHQSCRSVDGTSREVPAGVSDTSAFTSDDVPRSSGGTATSGEGDARDEELMLIGSAFASAYDGSIVSLVAALQNHAMGHGKRCGVDGLGVPARHEVAQWMLLHILFSDAEFRVSAYSGAVCYPTLPSLLLATSDHLQDAGRVNECHALQGLAPSAKTWKAVTSTTPTERVAAETEVAPLYSASSPHTRTYLSQHHLSSDKHGMAAAVTGEMRTRTASLQAGHPSTLNFRWLNGAAGCPPWTLAHAQLVMYDASVSSRRLNTEATPTPASGSFTDQPATQSAAAVQSPPSLKNLTGTSGHRLVDYFIQQSASTRVMGGAAATGVDSDKKAAQAFPTMGWNEGAQGSTVLRQYVADLSDANGACGFHMMQNATLRQPSGELYQANLRLIQSVFRHLLAVPIAVARLSTMLRWNLSIHHAGIYRSFLYFILVTGANPTVHRMATGVQRRIAATMHVADHFGDPGSNTTNRSMQKIEAADRERRAVEQQVRQELLAFGASPVPWHGLNEGRSATPSQSIASLEKRLRDAFTAEREVVHRPPLWDDRVVEVLCLRVLPHARPGGACKSARGSPTAATPSSFRGYPLQYIEVLPTWKLTPEEVLHHLRAAHLSEKAGGVAAASGHTSTTPAPEVVADPSWLETNEEPYILVCAMSSATVRGRLKAAAERFASIVVAEVMTLRQLSIISLWAHEYGVEMACEMLFVQLTLNADCVRLHPPAAPRVDERVAREGETDVTASSGNTYGDWSVEFL